MKLGEKNVREWESLMPPAKFAYNRSTSQTTNCSPFEAVYGMNPNGPLDLSPINFDSHFSEEADKRAQFIKKIHEQVRVFFNKGDLIQIHLRKERFPNRKYAKLQPRVDGPFKIVKKINDNAYKVKLPYSYGGVSATFNVSDLSPYHEDDQLDPRMSFLQQGRMMHGRSLTPAHLKMQRMIHESRLIAAQLKNKWADRKHNSIRPNGPVQEVIRGQNSTFDQPNTWFHYSTSSLLK